MSNLDTSGYRKGTLKDIKHILKSNLIAVDFESSSVDIHQKTTVPISVSFTVEAGVSYVYFLTPENIALVKPVLESDIPKVVAARPFDENLCELLLKCKMGGAIHDVLVAAHIDNENHYAFNLEMVASEYAGMKNIKSLAKGMRKNLLEADEKTIIEYNGVDSDSTFRSFNVILKRIMGQPRLARYYKYFIRPTLDMLKITSLNGVSVDTKTLAKNENDILEQLKMFHEQTIQLMPESLKKRHKDNLSMSRDDLMRDLLFTTMKLKPNPQFLTEKKKIPQINEGHIKSLMSSLSSSSKTYELLDKYMRWKKLNKVYTGYIKPLWDHIKPDGRIYPSTLMTRAGTGRTAMHNPPVQTYPQRGENAHYIKECIVADDGWLLGARDLSQSELRIMGWIANDRNIMNALNSNTDLHTKTAAIINSVPIDKVTKDMRRKAKGVNFGLIYGMLAPGLRNYLKSEYDIEVSPEEAVFIRSKFFSFPEGYYGLTQFYDRVKRNLHRDKYVTTVLGRRRRLPQCDSQNKYLVLEAERQAINMHGQSPSSDLALIGKFLFQQRIEKENLTNHVKNLWFIHDNNIFTAKEKYFDRAMSILKECMEEESVAYIKKHFGVTWGYKVTSDQKRGKTWATMKEY